VQRIVLDRPDPASQQALWNFVLGDVAARCNGHVERVSTQFSLDYEEILRTGVAVRRRAETAAASEPGAGEQLLASCRAGARGALDVLAQRIAPRASWRDIVLPEAGLESLRAIAAQVRQQGKVLERWGFAAQTSRGLGISALFHGPSGTGKTLAAEVLAHDLGLDLWRIDLSQMVSKYIGETEKNLRAIFDTAENTGSILLFDEADALFGRRSEVRDSHDRYANIEVSYLLQRIEAYRGLAILTSNLRGNLDTAFLRRITFFVSFPFPDQNLRRCIWERIFPSAMPAEQLDYAKLARLNLAGGNIRNIALNAAYIAADLDQPVRMEHLLAAARRECAKIDRPLTTTETGGWV
jgi:SpoVK/Ycf46/Vps4 family AAA+-type ATPase